MFEGVTRTGERNDHISHLWEKEIYGLKSTGWEGMCEFLRRVPRGEYEVVLLRAFFFKR